MTLLSLDRLHCIVDIMQVDVTTEITIDRPIETVATFAANPANVHHWYKNIHSIEWQSAPVVAVGSSAAFVAKFLGRTMRYTYRIEAYVPNQLLVMRTTEGPFPMETSYEWEALESSSTRMRLRNRGQPSGFAAITAPLMSFAIRRANMKDLGLLRHILEQTP